VKKGGMGMGEGKRNGREGRKRKVASWLFLGGRPRVRGRECGKISSPRSFLKVGAYVHGHGVCYFVYICFFSV